MEKELIKQINTGKLNGNKLEFAKIAIKESGLYSCRGNTNIPEYKLDEIDLNEIKKEQLEIIKKSLFDIEKEKMKCKLQKVIQTDDPITRFSTPIEILQYNIKHKPLLIDFDKLDSGYKIDKIIPLVILNKASYETLLHYLPNDFDPITYVKLNPELNHLTTEKEIKYHYLKYGRIKNLNYKEIN